MLNKKTLVELIRYCTVFEQEEKKDEKTGLSVSITMVGFPICGWVMI
jgi:type I restriction enzyme R subunit